MDRLTSLALQLSKLNDEFKLLVAEMNYNSTSPFDEALKYILVRQETKLTVYKDTLGIPTVGVGHVVRPEDNLKIGDTISAERAYSFLRHDTLTAFYVAQAQLVKLGFDDPDFLIALTSVNFQLGPEWTNQFSKIWFLIKEKQYDEASKEVAKSSWAEYAPARAKDFQEALDKLRSRHDSR